MWHGLEARENTAKMAVPPIKQLRLNIYMKGSMLKMSLRGPKSRGNLNSLRLRLVRRYAPGNDKEGCLKYSIRETRYEISAKIGDFRRP